MFNNEITRVDVLKSLRPSTAVSCPAGTGVVMVQSRGHVTVLVGRLVATYERWQVDDLSVGETCGVDFTDAEREWFRRPVTEVVA